MRFVYGPHEGWMHPWCVSFTDYLTCGSVYIHLVCVSSGEGLYLSCVCGVLYSSSGSLEVIYIVIYTSHVSLCLQATEIWGNYEAAGRAFIKIHVSNVLLQVAFVSKNITLHFFFPTEVIACFEDLFPWPQSCLSISLEDLLQQCYKELFSLDKQIPYLSGRNNSNCLCIFLYSW